MNEPSKLDVTVKARMYHARLLAAANDAGGTAALAREISVSQHTLGKWIRMDGSPFWTRVQNGEQKTILYPGNRKAVKKLCKLCRCKVTDLWPNWFSEVKKLVKKVEFTRSVDAGVLLSDLRPKDQPIAMIAGPVEIAEQNEERELAPEILDRLMECLPERLKTVIRLRQLDGLNLGQTGKVLQVSKERVRQLEMKAMRKLREKAGTFALDENPAALHPESTTGFSIPARHTSGLDRAQ